MATLSFIIKGDMTASERAVTWVTMSSTPSGELIFMVKQIGGSMGSLRGLYFEINDEVFFNSLSVVPILTKSQINHNAMTNVQNGTHTNLYMEANYYGFNSKLSNQSRSLRTINEYGFVLQSKERALALNDFLHIQQDNALNVEFAENQKGKTSEIYRWLYMSLV